MKEPSKQADRRPASRGVENGSGYAAPVAALIVAFLYSLVFLVSADLHLPQWLEHAIYSPRTALYGLLRRAAADQSGTASMDFVNGVYLALVGIVVPWIVMVMLRRGRLTAMGVRLPNRIGVRVLVASYVLSLPFLYWMVEGSGLPGNYLPHMRRSGAFAFLTYYVVNMLGEHFLLHGVMLAVLRPGMRWPDGSEVPTGDVSAHAYASATRLTPFVRLLRWIGLAQTEADWATRTNGWHGQAKRRHERDEGEGGQGPPYPAGGSPDPTDPGVPGATGGLPACAQLPSDSGGTSGREHVVLPKNKSAWYAFRIWIGLSERCLFAIAGSAFLFALVHVGKDPRELVLSLPGGIIIAYLAYRTNSFLTPFVLHLATAGTALAMMLMFE